MDIRGVTTPNIGLVTPADPKIRERIEKSLSAGVTNQAIGKGKVVGEQELKSAVANLEEALRTEQDVSKSIQYRKEIELLVGLIEKNGDISSIPPEEVLQLKEVLKKYNQYNAGMLFESQV